MALEKLKHPPMLACCGFSGSGKTTLLSELVRRLSAYGSRIGYLKHDVHGFSVDQPGKDTDRLARNGAAVVMIHQAAQMAILQASGPHWGSFETAFSDCQLLLLEGHKNLEIPKMVMLDSAGEMLQLLHSGNITAVEAVIGLSQTRPELPTDLQARPYFQRDNLDQIEAFVRAYFTQQLSRPCYGLILAGGYSSRMGRDKALLDYHGIPQLQRVQTLLQASCEQIFVSCRPEQWQAWQEQVPQQTLSALQPLYDRFLNLGPMGGLLTALQQSREVNWLAVACDLPLLSQEVLQTLIQAHQQQTKALNPPLATAFSSQHDHLPEPLCTLYTPAMFSRLLQFLGQGYTCPRKVLCNTPIQLLSLPASAHQALDNANHPEDLAHYRQHLNKTSIAKEN